MKLRYSDQRHGHGTSSSPARDPRPILPPTPLWKKEREAQKYLKRRRESIEIANRSIQRESKIVPPPPNYTYPNRQTRSLDPAPCVQIVPPPLTHNSQPDRSRGVDSDDGWSPKRLRSREPKNGICRQYVDYDSTDELDDNESVAAEPDEEKEYEVRAIDGERIAVDVHEYWIRWLGYTERTWTPSTDCFCPDLIAEMRAVQGADLDAARAAGREIEVEILEQLKEAAQAKAAKSKRANRGRTSKSRNSRKRKDGHFQQAQSGYGSIANFDSSDDDEVKNEPDMPRDARANTAWRRLGSAEREQASDTRYISWIRSNPIDVDALMDKDQPASSKTTVGFVEEWRTHSASIDMDVPGDGWIGVEDVEEDDIWGIEVDFEMQHASESDVQQLENQAPLLTAAPEFQIQRPYQCTHVTSYNVNALSGTAIQKPQKFGNDPEVITARRAVEEIADIISHENEQQQSVEEEVGVHQKLEEDDTRDDDHDENRRSRARSETFFKNEQDEENKLQERKSRRKAQQALENAILASFAPHVPSPLSQSAIQFTHDTSSPTAAGPDDNSMKLKIAREKEMHKATRKQKQNMPRLQFDSQGARRVLGTMRAQVGEKLENQVRIGPHTRSHFAGRVLQTIET